MRRLTGVRRGHYVCETPLAATQFLTPTRMLRSLPVSRFGALAPTLLLALLAGCADAPTVPASIRQLAGGEEWVAVAAPRDLPGLRSWLPYLDPSSPAGAAALARVRELSGEAEQARRVGRIARAAAYEAEAERVAVVALARHPAPMELQRALFAIDAWTDRVRAEGSPERTPRISEALAEVESARGHAGTLLARGDTTSAVLQISRAAGRIRSLTPTEVALRVLARAEEGLRERPADDPGVERALHMLASSREELLHGDARRALRRALYALQLAHGNQVPTGPQPECLGPGC